MGREECRYIVEPQIGDADFYSALSWNVSHNIQLRRWIMCFVRLCEETAHGKHNAGWPPVMALYGIVALLLFEGVGNKLTLRRFQAKNRPVAEKLKDLHSVLERGKCLGQSVKL